MKAQEVINTIKTLIDYPSLGVDGETSVKAEIGNNIYNLSAFNIENELCGGNVIKVFLEREGTKE